jgi:putative SOS response-associated peptidase YedK
MATVPAPHLGADRIHARVHMNRAFDELYSRPPSRRGKAITRFAIVTTGAAPSVAQYHNHLSVVLNDSQFDDWMRGTPDQAATLMKPYAGAIEAWEVGAEVGNVKNNRPELMERTGLL